MARKTSKITNKYGLEGYDHEDQHFFDKVAFAYRWGAERGCPSRVELFQRLAEYWVPGWFEWHPWTMRALEALCHNTFIGAAGCAGSSKTRNFAGFGCIWWLAAPEISSVTFCSTTTKALRKRGWKEVQSIFSQMTASGEGFGNFVDSQMVWQSSKGNVREAITGIAVEEGNTWKVADNIKGVHTERQMVLIDEANAVPPAIWDAATNLYKYPEEFVLGAMANPRSRIDQFGQFTEPMHGWDSVSVEADEWETKPQIDGKPGVCIRFDFLKTPNITEGKLVSTHLPRKEKVEARMESLRAKGGENDPLHWSNDRGFPPPQGLITTVFTETMFEKHKAYDRHTFTGARFTIIGALDPAFGGGARPALRFAALGEIRPGIMGIEWMAPIILFMDAKRKEDISYQLVELCQKHAKNVQYRGQQYRCLPEHFGADCSGLQSSFGDIIQREWSPKVLRIQFNGSPSEEPCSLEDATLACDRYRNKRAEMYFRTKDAVESGQIRGIDKESAVELTTIKYDTKGGKIVIQDKKDYMAEYGKSTDLADCGVEITEVARLHGFRITAVGHTATRVDPLDEDARKANDVYAEPGYQPEEEPYEEVEAFI